MKKFNLINLLALLVIIGCSSDEYYESLNKDPNNPVDVGAEILFTSAAKTLVSELNDIDYRDAPFFLFAQYGQQTTYTDESQYDIKNRGVAESIYSTIYQNVLYDLKDAASRIDNDPYKTAQVEILSIYAWQYLVDTFGDIPYSEALNVVGGSQNISPKYDDDTAIYDDLMTRAVSAKDLLSQGGFGFTNADVVLAGDKSKWTKFANGLIIKLGTRVPGDKFKSQVEAAYDKSLLSNADNITMEYEKDTPNTNPSWLELVQAGRNDFVVAKTIVDVLTSADLSDPRQDIYFDPSSKFGGAYLGGTIGEKSGWSQHSKIGTLFFEPTLKGVLMDFSEISFYLADAAARGWSVGGGASTHYTNGIKASFDYWGLTSVQADTYIAKPKVAFATADGSSDEKIGKQLWISLYFRGFEGWTVYRRYGGAPLAQSSLGAGDFKDVPRRFEYPVEEQSINATNYEAASTAIGGDLQSTKVFWDQ